ncbi:hypothetical protein DSM112329_02962 [Paraconexibacter sp. AEG42_29]|uniref:Secreted protein n=1 Tax=Paraconexibacter sp. AEG42_29 TaxID=2997339 RepID=A0AAU7AXC3_9ACTN
MTKLWIAGAAVTALLGASSPANAVRKATAKEHGAVTRATVSKPARSTICTRVTLSTVSTRWAKVVLTNRRGCPQGNGQIAAHKSEGRWRMVFQGSGDTGGPCSDIPARIPRSVARDLRMCEVFA